MTDFQEIEIVSAGPESVDYIANTGAKSFAETFAGSNSSENLSHYLKENFTIARIEEEMKDPESFFFLAFSGKEVAGYMKLNKGKAQKESFGNDCLEVERLYVLRKFKGRGIGKKLMNSAIGFALNNDLKFVWLGVWENNKTAILFYQKFGFEIFGHHEFILGNDHQRDILMRLELSS